MLTCLHLACVQWVVRLDLGMELFYACFCTFLLPEYTREFRKYYDNRMREGRVVCGEWVFISITLQKPIAFAITLQGLVWACLHVLSIRTVEASVFVWLQWRHHVKTVLRNGSQGVWTTLVKFRILTLKYALNGYSNCFCIYQDNIWWHSLYI